MKRTLAVTLSLSLAACFGGLDEAKPEPPDVSDLVIAYAVPSAELTEPTVGPILGELERRFILLTSLCGWTSPRDATTSCPGVQPFRDAVSAVVGADFLDEVAEVNPGRIQVGDSEIVGDGWVRIEHRCPGWDLEADSDRGMLDAVVGYTELGLDAVIFATADACRVQVGPWQTQYDGFLALAAARIAEARAAIFVLDLEILSRTATTSEQKINVEVDIGFAAANDSAALRVPLPDGTSLNFFAGDTGVGFLAKNGRWDCDFERRVCENNGQTVDLPR